MAKKSGIGVNAAKKNSLPETAGRITPAPGAKPISPPAGYKKYTPKKDFADTYDLPSYDSTNLTLIARDPRWIHAYWNIARSSMETLERYISDEFEKAAYTLRMHDVTFINFDGNNANHWFDLDFDPGITNNWYVNLWSDRASYCGEIGLRLRDGRFFSLARSNVVQTPKQRPSGRSDEIWMRVDDDSGSAPFVAAEAKYGNKKKPARGSAAFGAKRIYLSEDEVKAYYSRLSPLLRDVLRERLARSRDRYSLIVRKGENFLGPVLRGELSHGRFLKKIVMGSSEEFALIGGASELIAAGETLASERKSAKYE